MALSVSQVWEVRTTGSDNNGGAFKAGAAGTDRSQQDSAQVAIDNSTITTSITANVITFTGYSPSAADVGNVVQMLTGTNVTAGFYEITGQTGTTWTVSGAVALPTSGTTTNATGNMGGALATIGKLSGAMVAKNKAFIKGGAYSESATSTFAQSTGVPSNSSSPTQLIGYVSARTDGFTAAFSSLPVITYANGLNAPGISVSGSGFFIANLGIVHGTNTNNAWNLGGNFINFVHCKVNTFKGFGVNWASSQGTMIGIEITGGGAGATAGMISQTSSPVSYCWIHDNACPGVSLGATTQIISSLITNNSGATSDGIQTTNGTYVYNCTIYKSGRDGIRSTTNNWTGDTYLNNILSENGGFGINAHTSAGMPAQFQFDGNAFYNNTSGARNNMDDTSTTVINGVSAYTNVNDVTLSADPFVAKASDNYALNTTAGGGAAARGAGLPKAWPGSTVVGYHDFGAVQHQDSGGSAGMLFIPNLEAL